MRNASSFQRSQHHPHYFAGSQGQGHSHPKVLVNILVHMHLGRLYRRVHWEIRKYLWRQAHETPYRPLPHLPTEPVYRAFHQCGLLFHCRQGSAQYYQDHQGGHVYSSQWPIPQQKSREVPTAPHLGWDLAGHPSPPLHVIPSLSPPNGKPPQWHTLGAHKHILHIGKEGPLPFGRCQFPPSGTSVCQTYIGAIWCNYFW